jgi:hypothetical protein
VKQTSTPLDDSARALRRAGSSRSNAHAGDALGQTSNKKHADDGPESRGSNSEHKLQRHKSTTKADSQNPKDNADRDEPKPDVSLDNALKMRRHQLEEIVDDEESEPEINPDADDELKQLDTDDQIRAAINQEYVPRYYISLY